MGWFGNKQPKIIQGEILPPPRRERPKPASRTKNQHGGTTGKHGLPASVASPRRVDGPDYNGRHRA